MRHPALLAHFEARVENAFDIADKHLGERPTIVDFSLAGYRPTITGA